MSMLTCQAGAPLSSQNAPPLTWSAHKSVCEINPLTDRALKLAKAGAWACNLADNTLSWTSGVYDIFGLPVGTAIDRSQTVEMYTDQSRDELHRLREQAIAANGIFNFDAEILRPDGELRWMRINGELIHLPGADPILHGMKQDITEDKLRLEALRRLAENDALTGLASRAVYESRFPNRRRGASAAMPIGALVLFDLDGFKQINDRMGHLAGDACLRVFAERLASSFPDAILTARIGGDEFALVTNDDEPADVLEARVADFRTKLRAPILWRGHMFKVGATSGIAVPDDPYCYDPEELFVRADAALYATKRLRRSR
jgi:diguanylate cyclase (GGDEF)-like protein/PAS domain S-box-containing protein